MTILEAHCAIRSADADARIPVAGGTPKLHKGKRNPLPHRQVVEVAGSTFHCMSRLIATCLREVLN